RQHSGLRPRLGVAGGDLAAVRERGLHAGVPAALDDHHFMPGFGEVPGAGDADHAGAKDENLHCTIMMAVCPSTPPASGASSCAAPTTTSHPTRASSAR